MTWRGGGNAAQFLPSTTLALEVIFVYPHLPLIPTALVFKSSDLSTVSTLSTLH